MGEIKISFIYDPKTGKRELQIDYESDADQLPAEHEREHRQLIERLVGKKYLEEVGSERIREVKEKTPPQNHEEPPSPQGTPQKQGA